MWSRVDLNRRPRLRLFIEELSANLAENSEMIKAAELQRALSPCIRPRVILSALAIDRVRGSGHAFDDRSATERRIRTRIESESGGTADDTGRGNLGSS